MSRLTKSDFREPVNIGSDEMVSMNEMAEIVLSFEDRKLPIHHIPGPEGVRGRNSDNTLIKEKLGWAPTMKLKACHYLARYCRYLCIHLVPT
jgi:GDP-D-mannose 3',5'-epimerase